MAKYKCDHPGCDFSSDMPQGLGSHKRIHQPKPKKKKETSVSTDDVLRQLFPQGVPVDKLDSVQAWRRATEKMLA